jgi:AraC-like DNA-binding protein
VTGVGALFEEARDLSGTTGDRLAHLPDTATSLVFRTTAAGRSDLLVVGPRTRASYHTGKDLPVCWTVRLRPGLARPLLGVPIGELVDRVTPLPDLWGSTGTELARRLAGRDRALIATYLDAALRARLDTVPPQELERARLVRAATTALAAKRPVRLPDLARSLALSERYLRDLLTAGAGLAPKPYARITRLRQALTRGSAGPARLAHLAAATGYYDQSHMTAEFTTMMGVPPGAFFTGKLPAPQPC